MKDEKIDYLKRAIKRNYKRFIGERTDGTATLMDVLKLFNIAIDETRVEDYQVETIDYNIPSIRVIDKKTNTTYTAEYTYEAKLLNYSGSTNFINLVINNPICKLERLYYIGSTDLIIGQMTFTDGDDELIFEKEMGNSIGFGLDAKTKFVIRYAKNISKDGRRGKQLLLNNIYMIKNEGSTFNQLYTYGNQHLIEYDDNQDKYCYNQNGNVVYGVNNCDVKELLHYLNGICFESTDVEIGRCLPHGISVKEFPELNDNDKYQSGIVFRGGTDHGVHHTLTIFKTRNQEDSVIDTKNNKVNYDLYLNYQAIKWENFTNENGMPDHRKVVVASKKARYPRIDDGNITSRELKNITKVLDTEFEDNTFIQFVIKELEIFGNRMDIQNGVLEEVLDVLSPELFVDKTFAEIYDLVSSNKDEYFRIIKEQFENATHIKRVEEKGKSKVLKVKEEHVEN